MLANLSVKDVKQIIKLFKHTHNNHKLFTSIAQLDTFLCTEQICFKGPLEGKYMKDFYGYSH